MASTSTSHVQKSFKYDVFLSFRGEDTRHNFVSHLYKALEQNGIETYKDDKKIEKGERINNQLIESIKNSRFFIIVFSKDYAGSSWCLDELVKIMECRKTSEQTAYPVFYDVEPTEIRKQSGVVGEAFKKHENKEGAEKWRDALNETGNLAGWELKNTFNGDESKFIQIIVDDIFKKIWSSSSSVDTKLVGMETRIEGVLSSLELDADDVRMIGIWGMGGGGKTTLARAVFDRISTQFDGTAFVENVREVSKSSLDGLNKLQQQVLSSVLSKENITVSSVHEGTNMMKRMIRGRKVLIVLDDVDDIEQLEALAGETSWFKFGSRVIITTRDKQVLSIHDVKFIDVNLLSRAEAICLLSKNAFKRDIPIEGYEELSGQVVKYADGLPLTIKVLGSFLYGQNEHEWMDTLARLKTIPLKETLAKLELSYNSLEDDYKQIFLDVACLLKGWGKEGAITALESCGFHARNGLRVLEQRSLITISGNENLWMHDHIEEMGKNIVRRLHPNNPTKHSRLWIQEEIENILANDLGTQATKCITVNTEGFNCKILMKGLAKMKELRFLQVKKWVTVLISPYKRYESEDEVSNSNFDEASLYLPNALRFLRWTDYPFKSLPDTFQANNLVGLQMSGSNLVQLWKEGEEKACLKLRFLKFSNSRLRTLGLNVAPNLETLILECCHNLVELSFHVTANLKKLRIAYCSGVEKLNMPRDSPNLETLSLYMCTTMVELMLVDYPKLVNLDLRYCLKLTTLNFGITPNLKTLRIDNCPYMVELKIPAQCPRLVNLDLSDLKLTTLNFGITPNLKTLRINNCTYMVELKIPAQCPRLVNLDLNYLKLTTLHLGITPNLKTLSINNCADMVELHMPAECPKLINLNLSCLKLKTLNLGNIPNLETLTLDNCTDKAEFQIPDTVALKTLDLGNIPNIKRLDLKSCYDLVEINAPIGCLKELAHLDLSGCRRFQSFVFKKSPVESGFGLLSELNLIAESIGTCPLHPDNNVPKFRFKCFYREGSVSPLGNLEKLLSFGLCACTNIETFSESISSLRSLRSLKLEGCITEAPKYLDQLECLEELHFWSMKIKHLPNNICMLKHLKFLQLKSCWLIEKLPEDLGQLECLEELYLTECIYLRDIPESICGMKRLKYFHLPYCFLVEKLPEELGRLECLKVLNIEGTGISRLPLSIFQLKGLHIFGTRWRLESYGFTSMKHKSRYTSSCYV